MSIQRGNPRQRSGNRNQRRFAVQAFPAPSILGSVGINENEIILNITGADLVQSADVEIFIKPDSGVYQSHKMKNCRRVGAGQFSFDIEPSAAPANEEIVFKSAQNGLRNVNGGFLVADFFETI